MIEKILDGSRPVSVCWITLLSFIRLHSIQMCTCLTLCLVSIPVHPVASIGHVVTGAIEGKFEHGYLVTVVVGGEKLRGVIYHIPPGHRGPQYAHVPNYALTTGAEIQLPEKDMKVRRKRYNEDSKKDPNAPRQNRTGYNFFFAEERAKLKLLHPDKERELSRMIGDAWNGLSEEAKMVILLHSTSQSFIRPHSNFIDNFTTAPSSLNNVSCYGST